ncbi:MAG TPA: selenocysteine-specific translation elongation factor [Solirubrobacteraceae bacterium]|jgi:selenocysteine-specific elongation factor|nr:selenocysteine-specific translation elongation factor [Solirubrobacteraceae bacterium]
MSSGPLTLGTAGHVDHGKTSLIAALTGVDTDRLPEERARGLTIVLGYAPLTLPSGRRLSIVDVPGHERFVRTMVSGATGIDACLMVIAADDGVMPQTVEHAEVLRALDVRDGVVAVTKADLADPAPAARAAAELFPAMRIVPCSARTGSGLDELLAALEQLAAGLQSRAALPGEPVLHIDRVFTVPGRGAVVTGTLWSGALARGQAVALEPAGLPARVRGIEIHDAATERAEAGQRVAVNLSGVRVEQIGRGDVLTVGGAVRESRVLDCALELRDAAHGERVQLHHGTRCVPARLADLGGGLWQLRLEQPILARRGERLVVRRTSPPATLGGGEVLDPHAARHGRREDILARLAALRDGREPAEPSPPPADRAPAQSAPAPDELQLRELEQRLRDAGPAMLSEAQLGEQARLLAHLRERGRAVRVSGRLYAHAEVAEQVRSDVLLLLVEHGSVTLAGVRDALGLSRKSTQAFLEHLDGERVTRRLPDDRRVLASRARQGAESPT